MKHRLELHSLRGCTLHNVRASSVCLASSNPMLVEGPDHDSGHDPQKRAWLALCCTMALLRVVRRCSPLLSFIPAGSATTGKRSMIELLFLCAGRTSAGWARTCSRAVGVAYWYGWGASLPSIRTDANPPYSGDMVARRPHACAYRHVSYDEMKPTII